MSSRILVGALFFACIFACTDEGGDESRGDEAPTAPTNLTAESAHGGAHLTWSDNSDNELHFMVMRMEHGVDADYQLLATTTFDAVQYHDADVTSGTSYMYKITAMNDAGEADSNEVTFDAP